MVGEGGRPREICTKIRVSPRSWWQAGKGGLAQRGTPLRTLIMPFAVFDLQQWSRSPPARRRSTPPRPSAAPSARPLPRHSPRHSPARPSPLPLPISLRREHNERGHHFKTPQLSKGLLASDCAACQAGWLAYRHTTLAHSSPPPRRPSIRSLHFGSRQSAVAIRHRRRHRRRHRASKPFLPS